MNEMHFDSVVCADGREYMKGAGEITGSGMAGAIANAVWRATGKHARRFPIEVSELI